MQEVVKGSDVCVLFDDKRSEWADLSDANKACIDEQIPSDLFNVYEAKTTLWHIGDLRRIEKTQIERLDLIEIFSTFRISRSTDPRDKIYALRGLSAD